MEYDMEYDNECNCGECRLCLALSASDYDSDVACTYCGGAGCTKCEE